VYSFADLEREKTTILGWGDEFHAAVKHLREMKPGERLVIYHTGDEIERGGYSVGGYRWIQAIPKTPKVTIKVGGRSREAEDTGGN